VFGIGGPELIVILVLALLFIGPDKLPEVAKTVGSSLRDLRRAAHVAEAQLKESVDELARETNLKATLDAALTEPSPAPGERPAADGETVAVIEKRTSPREDATPAPSPAPATSALPATSPTPPVSTPAPSAAHLPLDQRFTPVPGAVARTSFRNEPAPASAAAVDEPVAESAAAPATPSPEGESAA
jgi:Tat protein translocase TatB subunit